MKLSALVNTDIIDSETGKPQEGTLIEQVSGYDGIFLVLLSPDVCQSVISHLTPDKFPMVKFVSWEEIEARGWKKR